jgi:hypothetical protein
MSEKKEDIIAEILKLCETDPDAGLELIEKRIRKKPESASDPFGKFAKAMAYGSKGLFKLARSKPGIDFTDFDEEELRENLGVTDTQLDYLEKGLQEIKEMEEIHPGALKMFGTAEDRAGELKVDAMSIVLERCRPGRVQQLLGKTKLTYFGPERVFKHNDCEITRGEFQLFRDIFFSCSGIAKSALFRLDGRDIVGRRYVTVVLYKEVSAFDRFGENSPVAGFICLYNDGAFTLGSSPVIPPPPPPPPPDYNMR